MRRLLAALLAALAAAVALAARAPGDEGAYRVDVIFDNAAFLDPGQDVRIAGAPVGRVEELSVTRDSKARVELSVERRFAPFRADATCNIAPQSLIGERYVQCAPGTPEAPELQGDPPVVPVENTQTAVDIDLVLGTFDRPARERLGILLGSLGAGLVSRGEDLNATIRRANPALQETRRVLEVLDADRTRLRSLIADADTVLSALARRRGRAADFVRQAATVASATAARRRSLAESVRRLPGFLDAAQPALRRLTTFARAGTPLARDLQAGAPDLDRLLRRTGELATDLRPALDRLAPVLRQTRRALPDITPQLARLARFARAALPVGPLVADLTGSLRTSGAMDGLGAFFYYGVSSTARFDRYSHILPAYSLNSSCALYTSTYDPACSAFYPSNTALRRAKEKRAERKPAPTKKKSLPGDVQGRLPTPTRPKLPPDLPQKLPGTVRDALDSVQQGNPGQAVQDVLDLLLG